MNSSNGDNKVTKKSRVLFIGYNFSYPKTIKDTLKNSNLVCSTLFFDKNIELYLSKTKYDQFDPIFNKIKNRVIVGNYTNFVLDIPNLGLHSSYENTMNVIKYLLDKGKLMILSDGDPYYFIKKFGEDYSNMVIDRKYMINCSNHPYVKQTINTVFG